MEEIPQTPRVSAVIVARNCAGVLRRCVEALNASLVRDALEVLIVDNGSSDESASLDAEFPWLTILRLPKNFGRSKALNIGIRTAQGESILILPPNVLVRPDTISRLVEKLESDRDAGAVCPYIEKTWRLPNEEWLRELWLSGTPPNGIPTPRDGGEVAVDFPLGAPMLIRRSVLTGMNYVDERYGDFGGDAEICFRIRNGGKKIVVLPDAETDVVEAAVPADTPVRSADVAIGAATYLSKHFGGGTGFRFRLSAMLRALGKIVTFQRPGYYFSLLMALVTNQKIDGTQSES